MFFDDAWWALYAWFGPPSKLPVVIGSNGDGCWALPNAPRWELEGLFWCTVGCGTGGDTRVCEAHLAPGLETEKISTKTIQKKKLKKIRQVTNNTRQGKTEDYTRQDHTRRPLDKIRHI